MDISNIQGTVRLANGVDMPYLGLGVYQAANGSEVVDAITYALSQGYRLVDTAKAYNNETGVGQAINDSEVARAQVFVTTKLWNSDFGYDSALEAFEASMQRLQLDYLDLYLLHWPAANYKQAWKALEHLYTQKKVRAIGVCNFQQHHLEDLMADCKVKPMLNQCEFHPTLVQPQLLEYCRQQNIQFQAWSPLMQGKLTDVPELVEIAAHYQKTPTQLVLRWDLQKGVATIPKSTNPGRIKENAQLFDFEITPADMAKIDALDKGQRLGPDPDNFNF